LPGKPDFAFPKQKVAVFVDGCFWHGCPKCYTRPKTNRAFWDKKRTDNMARDKRVTRQLRWQGWKVIRIWQHSLQKSPNTCLNRLRRSTVFAGGRYAIAASDRRRQKLLSLSI
jgi:DNA mismatch endonuclease (patch repair protein)